MPKFISKRVFKLDYLGEEWKDCFITFSSVSIDENRELVNTKLGAKTPTEITDITIKFLKDHFLDGVAYDSETKAVIPLKVEELGLLPSLIQEKAVLFLVGEPGQ